MVRRAGHAQRGREDEPRPTLVDPAGLVSAALVRLFPPSVAAAVLPVGATLAPSAYPEEHAVTARAVPARRRQFFTGRACAHLALAGVGRDDAGIGRGSHREPLWPAGAVGSISHAGALAGAVAARSADVWALGLDIETLDPPLDPAVQRLVHTAAELAPAATRSLAPPALRPYRSKIAFSAKECVYKALFPATGWPLDFHDATVAVDLLHGRYRAVVDDRFELAGSPLRPLDGRFTVVSGYLVTALTIGVPSRLPRLTA